MPEQEKYTTKDKWFKKWTSRLLWLAGQFEFVREVLIFTFFAWSFGFSLLGALDFGGGEVS